MVDVSLPAVAPDDVALFVIALLTGLCVPFRYGIEGCGGSGGRRFRGCRTSRRGGDGGRPALIEPDEDPEAGGASGEEGS